MESVDRFCELNLESIKHFDLHATWTPHDRYFKKSGRPTIRLYDLDPFFADKPWTNALQGKRVCVVSPFAKLMEGQVVNLGELFKNQIHFGVLEYVFVEAPVTNCDKDVTELNWFDLLDKLFEQVVATNCDVLLIGAGSYGVPLAHLFKCHGGVAIILGGITQLLFGIRGARWDADPQYAELYNTNWIRPDERYRPPGGERLEINGGAYW